MPNEMPLQHDLTADTEPAPQPGPTKFEEAIARTEAAAREIAHMLEMTDSVTAVIVSMARSAFVDGWTFGHDAASKTTIRLIREAGK